MKRAGLLGLGGNRSIILSALFWITLIAHVLTYLILLIFFFVSLARDTVTAAWYLTPFYWVHLVASGIFLAATINASSSGGLGVLSSPSVYAAIFMVLSFALNIIAGYFYIIDLWLPCIFGVGPSLNASEESICDNERLYVWVLWVAAIVLLILPLAGFIAALWDALIQLSRNRAVAGLSGVAGSFGQGFGNALGGFGFGRRGASMSQDISLGGEAGGGDAFDDDLGLNDDLDTYRRINGKLKNGGINAMRNQTGISSHFTGGSGGGGGNITSNRKSNNTSKPSTRRKR